VLAWAFLTKAVGMALVFEIPENIGTTLARHSDIETAVAV
jgi:hypothetical protein